MPLLSHPSNPPPAVEAQVQGLTEGLEEQIIEVIRVKSLQLASAQHHQPPNTDPHTLPNPPEPEIPQPQQPFKPPRLSHNGKKPRKPPNDRGRKEARLAEVAEAAAVTAAVCRNVAVNATGAGGSADEAQGSGPVWRGTLPYSLPDDRASGRVLQAAHVEAGEFAIRMTATCPLPPMPQEGGFCYCGNRWSPGSEHFDPTNRLDPDKDPQCGPCLGWLCVRIRSAGGPVGPVEDANSHAPTLPSEPYEVV